MSIVSTLVSIFRSRTRSLLTMAGIAAGLLISGVGCLIAGIAFQANWLMIGLAAVASGAVGAVFGAYPAYKASSLDPVEALRM